VGDEDLLDIIGNGKNVERIQKHFRKMFAGITSIEVDEEGANCKGIASKEGEEVPFQDAVAIKDRKINAWLTSLEEQMKLALAGLLGESAVAVDAFRKGGFRLEPYLAWLDKFQAQLVTLSAQISWSESARLALLSMEGGGGGQLQALVESVENTLTGLADTVLQHQPPIRRKKLEQVITELVHKRDLTREFMHRGVASTADFGWLQYMRFGYSPDNKDVLKRFTILMADNVFYYGYEYLGLVDKLVQTPLTDRCYLTMTQALAARQGGSPFGPAGTGKTESVKALGAQLGRFVLVFNCDETFDNHAMGRIFVGLCQVGAWGCFDEFNRLEESMLSAVSQQIESIQLAIKAGAGLEEDAARRAMTVSLQGRSVGVNPEMAIFITMNPGYAGRSPLPDNLKKLFRNLAMTKPDRQLIAQVMLYSQGFRTAEALSRKVVPLFTLCAEQLSAQSHYDFGLRSLKAVLVSAGNIKRDRLAAARKVMEDAGAAIDESAVAASIDEQEVVIQSITQTMIPKLVAQDIPLLNSLLADVFPGVEPPEIPLDDLRACIEEICAERNLLHGDMWLNKVLQLYQVTTLNHGLMMVGPSGSGKSSAWRVLLDALRRLEKKEVDSYVLDPKAMTKEELYGSLDPTTREWTDGLFTHIIRKIIDNVRGERNKRQWIVFDGDVDPEWVENLNSVLDDNKLLTLPNGERLNLPPNIRILFEVQDLKYATLATVSRCGMVWFSAEVLSLDMYYQHFLRRLRSRALGEAEGDVGGAGAGGDGAGAGGVAGVTGSLTESDRRSALQLQNQIADVFAPFFEPEGLVTRCLEHAADLFHVMDFTDVRCLNALFSMLNQVGRVLSEYNVSHPDFPLDDTQISSYASKRFIYALIWSLVGDSRGAVRSQMCEFIRSCTTVELPPAEQGDIIDFEVTLPEAQWQSWTLKVPRFEIEAERVAGTDVVVPTLDTVRHEDLLNTWLGEHLPIVLCGPPGSGKTMTLFSALRALPHFEVAGLNFSSTTTPDLLMKTFDQYCEYRRTASGVVLAPAQVNKWLVVFMDECNLPAEDKYATVRVITFIRQLVEQGGFWRTQDHTWVRLERIQFVGACNPPTDPGRVPLMHRFLRHVPVVYVDYPGAESLKQIYGTFNRAILRSHAALERYGDTLTDAMVDFYSQSQARFTADMQPHYIYSPREMTRWVKGVAEAISPLSTSGTPLTIEGLVRIWAHEALRLFQDRLVYEEERRWTDAKVDEVAEQHFAGADLRSALARPILFSDWLTEQYEPVDLERLREYVHDQLQNFTQEQMDVELVLFDEVLDHVLRIDRVFRQNQGHMLLIGTSGCGRTTLSRFVAWKNQLSVVQIKAHSQYTADDFDVDLRDVLRRSGVEGEKIVFILDEGNVMDTAFLERMNTLLANGEVPGLFEGDEYSALMTKCKEATRRAGKHLDDNDELYRWFSRNVMDNLHIVFTMCPSESGMQDRASTSPALFNRCVLDWFGDWPDTALLHVARKFTEAVALEREGYEPPMDFPVAVPGQLGEAPSYRDAVHNAAVFVHQSAKGAVRRLQKREGRSTAITPRHFLEFINQFTSFIQEKRTELAKQREHLLSGVVKIKETRDTVEALQGTLQEKREQLEAKSIAAKEKLNLILGEKQAANEKKEESLNIEKELKIKQAQAEERKAGVEQELAAVAPAVEEAKAAVEGIRKKDLQEIRSLANPPQGVKVALEGALTLMGKHTKEWKAIRSLIAQDTFTSDVLNFDSNGISRKSMSIMEKEYLNDPLFTFEKANRASKAAGPLVKWALAQVAYGNQLLKVEPLNNELKELEAAAAEMRQQQDALQVLVGELEEKIQQYEQEYAVLISEQEAIKSDLNTVTEKVQRSEKLLTDLASERERWSTGAEDFDSQMATIVGDCLVAAAFMSYGGYFDQRYRQLLLSRWTAHLHKARIVYKPGVEDGIPEYLSAPDDRMRWKTSSLPDDELCVQNAVMLQRSLRTPLVIDPAGQAAQFIRKENNRDGKLLISSFLNPSQLRKDLESALRFGTTLFVQDAEAFDPLLNPVLNNEVQRKGGRVFVNVAGKDIDLSPSFSMILITRNASAEFPVDLCSRVTLVNFTVTRGSLMTQCLNQALRCERPDVDEQRADLLRMQGEFRLRLLNLENALLDALNKAEGSILDDDKVISQLETLKNEAMDVQKKVDETDTIMATVNDVSRQYQPLAQRCSAIYFTLEQMTSLHFLYQFSLQFFLDIFRVVLTANPHLEGESDHAKRLEIINDTIFRFVFDRVAPGMLHEHRMPLALTFARFRVAGTADEVPEMEMAFFLQGRGVLLEKSEFSFLVPNVATEDQAEGLHHLASGVQAFKNLVTEVKGNTDAFKQWLASSRPETSLPSFVTGVEGGESNSAVRKAFRELLLLGAARPDRVLSRMHQFVELVLGKG
jgi:dynein heavy chain 1